MLAAATVTVAYIGVQRHTMYVTALRPVSFTPARGEVVLSGPLLAPHSIFMEYLSSMQAMLQQLEEGASLTALFTGVVRVFVQMRLGCSFTKLNPIRHSCSTIVHRGRLRTWLNMEQAGALVGMGLGCCLKKTKAGTTASPDEMKRMLQDE